MNALVHKDSTRGHFHTMFMPEECILSFTEMADKGRFTVEQKVNLFSPFSARMRSFVAMYRHCAHLGTVGPFTRNIQAYLTFSKMIHFQSETIILLEVCILPRT
jgi:hypothetical protein